MCKPAIDLSLTLDLQFGYNLDVNRPTWTARVHACRYGMHAEVFAAAESILRAQGYEIESDVPDTEMVLAFEGALSSLGYALCNNCLEWFPSEFLLTGDDYDGYCSACSRARPWENN